MFVKMADKIKEPFNSVPFVCSALMCTVITGLALSLLFKTGFMSLHDKCLPDADTIPKVICNIFSAKSVYENKVERRFSISGPKVVEPVAPRPMISRQEVADSKKIEGVVSKKPLSKPFSSMTSTEARNDATVNARYYRSRKISHKQMFQTVIFRAANQYGIDPALVQAIIFAESTFNPKAVSKRGAMGLMQLMPNTAEAMGVKDCFNPEHNIFGGVRYFKKLIDQFGGDTTLALAAYNAGGLNVRRFNGVPPFKATRCYVKKVLKYYDIYKKQLVGAKAPA